MELVKITYRFADGHVEELQVEQGVAQALEELEREERNHNRRETRRHERFSDIQFEGEAFADPDADTALRAMQRIDIDTLRAALLNLNSNQQELVWAAFYHEESLSEIARSENVDKSAISHRMERIYRRLRKFFD